MYIWYTRGKVEKKKERESLTVKVAYKRGTKKKKKVNSIL